MSALEGDGRDADHGFFAGHGEPGDRDPAQYDSARYQEPTDREIEVLRSLPPELPQPSDRFEQISRLVRRNRYRKGLLAGCSAAAAVVLAVPLSMSLLGDKDDSQGSVAAVGTPSCPKTLPDQVPGGGSGTRVPADRLVPQAVPSMAVLCSYLNEAGTGDGVGTALSGNRKLTGGLANIPSELSGLPRDQGEGTKICTMMAGPVTYYLMALGYSDGVVWVRATDDPNGCGDTTNGTFTSSTSVGKSAAAAYKSGVWEKSAQTGKP